MNPVETRIRRSLELLLEKSRKDEVRWRKIEPNVYSVSIYWHDDLQGYRTVQVLVAYSSPEVEPDAATVMLTFDGCEIFRDEAIDGSENFAFNKALFDEARRFVGGWDDALDILDSVVSQSGIIGLQT